MKYNPKIEHCLLSIIVCGEIISLNVMFYFQLFYWQAENFPNPFRRHVILWESLDETNPNILTAEAIQEMWRVHQQVAKATIEGKNKTYEQVCNRMPSLNIGEEEEDEDDWELGTLQFKKRRRRQVVDEVANDMSLALSRETYCDIIGVMPSYCNERGLLEVWGYNDEVIRSLTDQKVLDDVNNAILSEVFGYTVDFKEYLGEISYDSSGNIAGAKAARHMWTTEVDNKAISEKDYKVDTGTGILVDRDGMDWEKIWIDIALNTTDRPSSIKANVKSESSFGLVSDDNIWGDVNFLVIGLIAMSVFVNLTLGRRNMVEQRPILTAIGMLNVWLAIFCSYGLCSYFGVKYNPVNSILPLLLLGLGVDDMFIILAIWDSKREQYKDGKDNKIREEDLIKRAGDTMRHAGVAITATSITDVTAFAIGASTDLPALRSFCIYASVGIFTIFILQCTVFVAFLVIDEKRMSKNRNGCFWCYKHRNYTPSSCSQVDILNVIFKWYGEIITKRPVQVISLVLTVGMLTVSVIGSSQLHKEFNPQWFIPQDSYLAEYFKTQEKYFVEDGLFSFAFFSNVSLADNLDSLKNITNALSKEYSVLDTNRWPNILESYINASPEFANQTISNELLLDALPLFLESPSGAEFMNEMVFGSPISCHESATSLDHFRILFKFRPLQYSFQQEEAMQNMTDLFQKFHVPGFEGIWSEAYATWETNGIVGEELLRNLGLAGLVIAVMTFILLSSLIAAVMVLLCVVSTIVGVGACLYVYGLTIDTVSCISLVLCIGLSVDYSVHIAHAFLSERSVEDRRTRISQAVAKVGPAVLQGGISTLIPFVMLAFSNSHVFKTFFCVFTPTTLLGLFYALVTLPVMLSLIGPAPYAVTDSVVTPQGHDNDVVEVEETSISSKDKKAEPA